MTKITLNNVTNLVDTTTSQNTINANSATVQAAFDNTLSLDGTQPNQLRASIDMNNNHILNLPAPITVNEPLRLVDANTLNGGGTITVQPLPAGGTTGQVLVKNSGTNYDAGWNSSNLPTGGTVNQILAKNSSTNYDASWFTPATLPSGFITGPVSSTDKNAVRFSGTSGATAQNSVLNIADTTGALTRTGGGGIPIQGMNTNAAPIAAGFVGEYVSNIVLTNATFTLTSGSGGQVWNSINLTAGVWLVGCQSGVIGTPLGSSATVFTHMHSCYGNGITSILTSPGSGSVTAQHVTTNNANGWILANGPIPFYLTSSATMNAVLTSDFTGGTAGAYGTIWAIRIA